jgi:hypothetical protein
MADDERKAGRRRRAPRWTLILLAVAIVLLLVGFFAEFEYAYVPPQDKLLNPERINLDIAYDVWGRSVRADEAEAMLQTVEGRLLLSPANGAVRIDEETLRLGRKAFYTETFSNENLRHRGGRVSRRPADPLAVRQGDPQAAGAGGRTTCVSRWPGMP